MTLPIVSIAVISFNRLKYLRATLESMRQCIRYPNIQWIVVDGDSQEPGLKEYLKSLSWLDECVINPCSHAEAMNRAVALARGEVLLLWPDDVQFTVAGEWMAGFVEILAKYPAFGSIALNHARRLTVATLWGGKSLSWLAGLRQRFGLARVDAILESQNGWRCISYRDAREGIIGSGIPSLTRTEIWRQLGPWKTAKAKDMIDSGGGEDEMLARFRASTLKGLQRLHAIVPVAADIVDDDLGCKAKVRGGKRYGVYMSPPEGTFYYRIREESEVKGLNQRSRPVAFEELVEPIGYRLPLDADGNLRKGSINQTVVSDVS